MKAFNAITQWTLKKVIKVNMGENACNKTVEMQYNSYHRWHSHLFLMVLVICKQQTKPSWTTTPTDMSKTKRSRLWFYQTFCWKILPCWICWLFFNCPFCSISKPYYWQPYSSFSCFFFLLIEAPEIKCLLLTNPAKIYVPATLVTFNNPDG